MWKDAKKRPSFPHSSSFATLRLCVRPAGAAAAGNRGTGPLCAQHPSGRSVKGGLSPFSPRRGVLLLLILALLSMFGLIAVAFVVISGQAQRSAKSIERIGLTDDLSGSARTLLQQAAMQVLRGSTSTASVMGAHSLLEEMYGTSPASGSISARRRAFAAGRWRP